MVQTQPSSIGAGIDPRSILANVLEQRPLATQTPDGKVGYLSGEYWATVRNQGIESKRIAIQVVLDPGNSECKTAALNPQKRTLAVVETPALFEEHPNLIYAAGTSQDEIWRVRNYDDEQLHQYREQYSDSPDAIPPQYGDAFSIGDSSYKGKSLSIGATNERLHDIPYRVFLQACVVRTLAAAGYKPGTHYVGYALGVRNEEVSAASGVNPKVKAAVNEVLRQPFVLARNGKEIWHIIPVAEDILMIPQSFGMYYAWDTDVYGNILHKAPAYSVFDLGYHDGHIVEIMKGRNGGLRVSGHKVTQGVSEIARGLAVYMRQPENFPQLPQINDAEAQEMMRSEEVRLGGIPLQNPIEAQRAQTLIRAYKHRMGETFVASLVSQHPAMDSIFLFGGGGVVEFRKEIEQKMKAAQRDSSLFFIFDEQLAVIANVIGLFLLKNISCRAAAAHR